MKVLVNNRKAFFDYAFSDELNAGLVLNGAEAKSLKQGQASLKGSYISIRGGEAYLVKAHISPYKYSPESAKSNPERDRKLLLKKKELSGLLGKEKGTVIVPLEILQTPRGLVKIKIGIGRSKKKFDKRETIKKRDIERRIRRGED